jgi:hypothetical protein
MEGRKEGRKQTPKKGTAGSCQMSAVFATSKRLYESVPKSFRTGRPERELQMVQLSATKSSCIAILWVSLVTFAAMTLCVASQQVIPKVSIFHYRLSPETFGYTHVCARDYEMNMTAMETLSLILYGNMILNCEMVRICKDMIVIFTWTTTKTLRTAIIMRRFKLAIIQI